MKKYVLIGLCYAEKVDGYAKFHYGILKAKQLKVTEIATFAN